MEDFEKVIQSQTEWISQQEQRLEQAKIEQNQNHEKFTQLTTESVTALSKKVNNFFRDLKDAQNTLGKNDITLRKMEMFRDKMLEEIETIKMDITGIHDTKLDTVTFDN